MQDVITRLLLLSFKTSLGYFVFLVSFFSVPLFNEYRQTGLFNNIFSQEKHSIIGDTTVIIKIADSEEERIKGLSGQASLAEGNGLFFIFDSEDYHKIWMKDMKFAIDVIWFDKTLQVIDFAEKITPETYPETFGPDQKAKYLLEVPAGFVSKNHIKFGDQLSIL